MPEAAKVISFPVDASTTGFLREFSGDARDRLANVVGRLEDLSRLIYFVRTSEEMHDYEKCALSAIEQVLRDCIAVAELRPMGEVA